MIWTIIWDDKTTSRVVTEHNNSNEAIKKAMMIKTFNGAREIFATVKGDVTEAIKFPGGIG